MTRKKETCLLNAAWLKWTAVPLLAFVLGMFVTKQLAPTRSPADVEQPPKIVATSLEKLDLGDRAGALDGLVRAGAMAPDDLGVQASLIGNFQALGEHKLVAEAIERLLRAMPTERQMVESYAGLCEYLLDHGDIDNAKRVLAGDLIARWPDALETAYIQAAAALKGATGEDGLSAAAMQLQECVALDPEHVPSKLQLGIARRRLGELDQAEALLRKVLEKQPFDPEALYHLGEVLRQQGNTAQAAKVLDEHERVSELQERRKLLESQYFLNRLQPDELLELGRIYAQLEDFAQAARTLRAYTRRQPDDAGAQRELANVCLKIDDKEGTRIAIELADALDAAPKP